MSIKCLSALCLAFLLCATELLAETVWIDVRSQREYNRDHIEGDMRVSYGDILEKVTQLYPDKSTPINLYCAAGGRAQIALTILEKAGYTQVMNVGGIHDARQLRE